MSKPHISPSGRYVAMCNKGDFSGFYFKKFTVPEDWMKDRNNAHYAGWFFFNVLDPVACVEKFMTQEDYENCVVCEQ